MAEQKPFVPDVTKVLLALDTKTKAERFYFHEDMRADMDHLRMIKTRDQKSVYLESREYSILDLYILYAANALRISDIVSIQNFLLALKKKNPSLAYRADDIQLVRRHIHTLVTMGLLCGIQYVANTKVHLRDAYDMLRKIREEEFEAESLSYMQESDLDLDTLELHDDDVELFDYDKKGFEKTIDRAAAERASLSTAANETFHNEKFTLYYGKDAVMVRLYYLDDYAYTILTSTFGEECIEKMSLKSVKSTHVKLGLASCGFVASKLALLEGFQKFKRGLLRSKDLGNFLIPVEMEFSLPYQKDEKFTFYCAVFHAYYYDDPAMFIKGQEKGRVFYTIRKIRNYIGVRGLKNNRAQDGFCVVVVNDKEDLSNFLDITVEAGVTEAEYNRIFFTSEALVRTDLGVSYMLQAVPDKNSAGKLELRVVPFPVK